MELEKDFLEKHLNEILEHEKDVNPAITGIVDIPKGSRQDSEFDLIKDVWIDQHCMGEDFYYGSLYYPLPSGKYLRLSFQC